jgi:hypothetical protein
VKSWGQLNQYLSSFEARAGPLCTRYLCIRWSQGPLLAPQSMRVPLVPWGACQGQRLIDTNIQLIIGLAS